MSDTMTEHFLLEWLSKEDVSAYGECSGRQLDSLVDQGLVEVRGRGDRAAVSLTDAGWAKLKERI